MLESGEDNQREMTIMNMLRMLLTLVRSMDESAPMLLALQPPMAPIIQMVLSNVWTGP